MRNKQEAVIEDSGERELDLIGQNLSKKNARQFARFWSKKIGEQYNALTLLQNELHLTTGAVFFNDFPQHITCIDISNNKFFLKTTPQLLEFLAAAPPWVTKMTLTVDDIKDRSDEELIELGQSKPFDMTLSLVTEKGAATTHRSLDIVIKYTGLDWLKEEFQALDKTGTGLEANLLILGYLTPLPEKEIRRYLQQQGFFPAPRLAQATPVESIQAAPGMG